MVSQKPWGMRTSIVVPNPDHNVYRAACSNGEIVEGPLVALLRYMAKSYDRLEPGKHLQWNLDVLR